MTGGVRSVTTTKSFDFVPLYSGSRCLLKGCNPYDVGSLDRSFLDGGGKREDRADWHLEVPIYPPSTFIVFLPFSLLPFHVARIMWLLVNGGVFILGCALVSQLVLPQDRIFGILGAAVVLAGSTALPGLGNPAGLSIGCLFIAVWAFLRRQNSYLAVCGLGISLAIKPHLAIVIAIALFCYREYRLQVVKAAVGAFVILAVSATWLHFSLGPVSWISTLSKNLKDTTSIQGNSYPGPTNPEAMRMTNVQTIFAVLDDNPKFYEIATWGLTLFIGVALVWTFFPLRNSANGKLLALSLATWITLMPVYHRLL